MRNVAVPSYSIPANSPYPLKLFLKKLRDILLQPKGDLMLYKIALQITSTSRSKFGVANLLLFSQRKRQKFL